MAPGGTLFRFAPHFGENVLRHGSHEWLPYSKNEVRLKSSNNNLSYKNQAPFRFSEGSLLQFYSLQYASAVWAASLALL